MKDDCNEQVEKDSGHIFGAILVKVDRLNFLIWQINKKRNDVIFNFFSSNDVDDETNSLTITKDLCYIVLDRDEHDGKLGCYLEWHTHTFGLTVDQEFTQ